MGTARGHQRSHGDAVGTTAAPAFPLSPCKALSLPRMGTGTQRGIVVEYPTRNQSLLWFN